MRAIALALAGRHTAMAARVQGTARAAGGRPAPTSSARPPRPQARLRWQRELLRVAVIYLAYDAIRLLPNVAVAAANRNGRRVLDLEQQLHLDPEHAVNAWLHRLPTAFPVAASVFYESMHYLITPIVLIWLFRTAKGAYPRARTWLATMTLSALVVFWLFPVTPPRLLPGSHLFDIVAEEHGYGWWGGGGGAPHGFGSFVDEYAAMPSLHVGWALWCGVVLFQNARHRLVRIAGLVYPLITATVVVSTGNHYLVDAVAGVVVAGLAWLVAGTWSRRRSRGPAVPAAAGAVVPTGPVAAPQTGGPTAIVEPPVVHAAPAGQPRSRTSTGAERPGRPSPNAPSGRRRCRSGPAASRRTHPSR